MICHICLSEKVRGQIDELQLCDKCLDKVAEYWDEKDVQILLDEVAEEMEGGRNMFKFLIDETIADTYPRKEDKWDDLK